MVQSLAIKGNILYKFRGNSVIFYKGTEYGKSSKIIPSKGPYFDR